MLGEDSQTMGDLAVDLADLLGFAFIFYYTIESAVRPRTATACTPPSPSPAGASQSSGVHILEKSDLTRRPSHALNPPCQCAGRQNYYVVAAKGCVVCTLVDR